MIYILLKERGVPVLRKLFLWLLIGCLLIVPVSASGITSAQSQSVVAENGSCQVNLTFTLVLDEAVKDLSYPLPADARDITVNGAPAFSSRDEQARRVSLGSAAATAGTHTVAISYRLPDTVSADKNDNLFLSIQLLSGFGYSIDNFAFTVTLPGPVDSHPDFQSTYYQEAVESVMEYTFTDGVLTGKFTSRIQDHDTLTMTLPVTSQLFPQSMAKQFDINTLDLMMIICAVIALIYWLVTMRCSIPPVSRTANPPEGMTAGELGCHLTGQGADLTAMVLSWAQMGYILIHLEDSGRVLLHKRMEMGSERSGFENKTFRSLFGRRKVIDGTGYHYARLCRKVAAVCPGLRDNFQKGAPNPRIFRTLVSLIGLLSGISLATSLAADTFWQVFLAIILGSLGAGLSWLVQLSARRIHSHDKMELWLAISGSFLWLLLSILAQEWDVAVCVLPAYFLAGLASAYGGRRSDTGMHNMSQILGLRRHLKTVTNQELLRILKQNPNYFYDLAPYALALDVDKNFARQLGNRKLPGCIWLTTGMDGHLTAAEWDRLLRDTAQSLDALQKRLPLDRILRR